MTNRTPFTTLITLTLIALLTLALPARAEGPTITAKVDMMSAKMFDIGIVFYHKPIAETLIFVDWPNGFGLDVYHSTGLGQCFENESCNAQETDIEGYWNGAVAKYWRALVQASYFSMAWLNSTMDGDTAQLKGRIQYTGWGVKPFIDIRGQYFIPTGEAGLAYSAVGADWSTETPLGTLSLTGLVAYDSTPFLMNHGLVGEIDVGLWHPLGKHAQVGAWGKLITPLSDFNGEDRGGLVGGVGIKYAF